MNEQTFAILTALDHSVRVPLATNGKYRHAGSFAKHYISSLREIPTVAYSGAELAATLKTDGKIERHAGRTIS
jgi:hypothetical protein